MDDADNKSPLDESSKDESSVGEPSVDEPSIDATTPDASESDETTSKVLTEEEKNALVEGVESGEIEVQSSNGPTYASVLPFKISARAHIVKNGYPRLKLLNSQVAERIARDVEQLLLTDVRVDALDISVCNFGRVCERLPQSVAAVSFAAAPLQGFGLLTLEASMVRLLVDTFFGGDGAKSDLYPTGSFTTGELSVSNLFADIVLSAFHESWKPLQEIVAERVATEASIDLVDVATESDPVIATEFEFGLSDRECTFQVLFPTDMLQPLLPIFDGQKGDRNPVEDARWAKAIQRRVAESVVSVTSNVNLPRMTLGELVELCPGDVIEIEKPHKATVLAENIRLIDGRLGVHQGRNAIETVEWIDRLEAEIMEMRS